jgi:hypothetical protein
MTSESEGPSRRQQTESRPNFVAQPSLGRFARAFRQLGWSDRLNVLLAGVLEIVLLVLLSPILLVSRICLLARPKRSTDLAVRSQQPR